MNAEIGGWRACASGPPHQLCAVLGMISILGDGVAEGFGGMCAGYGSDVLFPREKTEGRRVLVEGREVNLSKDEQLAVRRRIID